MCLSIRPSIHLSYICPSVSILFPDDNSVNINGFSPNLVCALLWILFGIADGQFWSIFDSYLPAT